MNSFISKAFAITVFFTAAVTDCCCDSETYYRSYATPNSYTIPHQFESYNYNTTPRIVNRTDKEKTTGTTTLYSSEFLEVRLFDGWSNMNEHIESAFGAAIGNTSTVTEDCDTYYEVRVPAESCTTPPTMAHLVLDSLGDDRFGGTGTLAKGKSWEVTAIVDGNGMDLSQDPEWVCLSDNEYFFGKDGNIEYRQGNILCEDEVARAFIWVYFSVKAENPLDHINPGDITININAADLVDDFDDVNMIVVSSDFDELVVLYTHTNGETARVTLNPI